MLKPDGWMTAESAAFQPPSGGCVLKQTSTRKPGVYVEPAAFGRLCVETLKAAIPAASKTPAAFGRLCVETILLSMNVILILASRLRAAVC